jgi:hypothetical protein
MVSAGRPAPVHHRRPALAHGERHRVRPVAEDGVHHTLRR